MTLSERLRDAEQGRSECFDSDGTPIESAFRDLGFNASYLFKEAADELDRLTARVAELEKDAERYRWLRNRIKVREEKSLAGSYRDSIYVRVGQSFFDTPTRGERGYTEPEIYRRECLELDSAIDAARRTE